VYGLKSGAEDFGQDSGADQPEPSNGGGERIYVNAGAKAQQWPQ